jgi:small GTP-binding protein
MDKGSKLDPTVLKFLLVGDSGVGKSSLLLRYVDDTFTPSFMSTIGIDFKIKTTKLLDGTPIKLQIWDTAGQERFRTITSAYYRGAMAVIIVYDIGNKESFNRLNYWIEEVELNARIPKGPVKVIVGNKCDDVERRCIGETEGKTFANQRSYHFMETSSLSGKNVKELFNGLAEKVYKQQKESDEEDEKGSDIVSVVPLEEKKTENKKCC